MDVHCVITGQNQAGDSVVVRNMRMEPIIVSVLPGYEFLRVWGSDSVPQLPSDANGPQPPRFFPSPNGFRFGFFTVPPDGTTSADASPNATALEELQQKLPGFIDFFEPDRPGMHSTATIDFDVIVSGEVYLEMGNGSEVALKAGDCVVQNGTRHAWRNRSSANCVIAFALVGAERR